MTEIQSNINNNFLEGHKFEAIRYRHEDQSKLLQHLSMFDFKLYGGFLTMQLTLGGFLTQYKIETYSKIGLFVIDIVIAIICIVLLFRNFKFRKKIGETILNCNIALGYEEIGAYIKEKKINANFKFQSFFYLIAIGLIASVFGIFFLLFSCKTIKPDEKEIIANTEEALPKIKIENNPIFINNNNGKIDTVEKLIKCHHRPCSPK